MQFQNHPLVWRQCAFPRWHCKPRCMVTSSHFTNHQTRLRGPGWRNCTSAYLGRPRRSWSERLRSKWLSSTVIARETWKCHGPSCLAVFFELTRGACFKNHNCVSAFSGTLVQILKHLAQLGKEARDWRKVPFTQQHMDKKSPLPTGNTLILFCNDFYLQFTIHGSGKWLLLNDIWFVNWIVRELS